MAGAAARRSGKPITACPYYGDNDDGETLREAFREAWQNEDKERRK